MQVFVTDKGFTWVCPMAKKADCHKALKQFFKVKGIPDAIVCDSAKAQIHGGSAKVCREAGVTVRALEAIPLPCGLMAHIPIHVRMGIWYRSLAQLQTL